MTERLVQVSRRLDGVKQLTAVVTAMRGIAAVRVQEAQQHVDAIREYAATVGSAIGEALGLLTRVGPVEQPTAISSCAIIAFCAEQGFVGSFNERILDAVDDEKRKNSPADILMIGDRGLTTARERGIEIDWSAAMPSRSEQVSGIAGEIADQLYKRLETNSVTRVLAVHAIPSGSALVNVVTRSLVPFDYDRFPVRNLLQPPMITMEPRNLVEDLAAEYLFAELCEAAALSFAAENEARMHAMIAAKTNVDQRLEELTGLARRLRQEEITSEVVELSSGVLAGEPQK